MFDGKHWSNALDKMEKCVCGGVSGSSHRMPENKLCELQRYLVPKEVGTWSGVWRSVADLLQNLGPLHTASSWCSARTQDTLGRRPAQHCFFPLNFLQAATSQLNLSTRCPQTTAEAFLFSQEIKIPFSLCFCEKGICKNSLYR